MSVSGSRMVCVGLKINNIGHIHDIEGTCHQVQQRGSLTCSFNGRKGVGLILTLVGT